MLQVAKDLPGSLMTEPAPSDAPAASNATKLAVSVVIPVLNEELAIGDDLDNIKRVMDESGHTYEVIVVDDGSVDKTAEVVAQKPWVRLIRHPRNKGVGAARKTGTLASRYNIVVMTDGDGTYPVHDIPRLVRYMETFDMVVGARQCEAGTMKVLRVPAKWFLRKLAEYITTFRIPDLNSGLRAFRKDLALQFFHILPERHSWVSTITLAFLSSNFDVKYVPIEYYPRKGQSTFHPIEDTAHFFLLLFRTVMYFKPIKILLPVSALIMSLGLVRIIRNWDVVDADIMVFLVAVMIGVLALFADMMVKLSKKREYI